MRPLHLAEANLAIVVNFSICLAIINPVDDHAIVDEKPDMCSILDQAKMMNRRRLFWDTYRSLLNKCEHVVLSQVGELPVRILRVVSVVRDMVAAH